MISLSQIEQDLTAAMKAKDQVAVDTLRGLKTRIQNEKTAARGRPDPAPNAGEGALSSKANLTEAEIVALIRSEVKRRKEAAASFSGGGRAEMAAKELREAGILEKYLPAQMSEEKLQLLIAKVVSENNFTVKDFGAAMGKLKAEAGDSADGALLAKLLKEKLK
jgi:uncharacterized protein YqeY